MGMPRHSKKAQDSQPERREDSKQRVEVSGQRTNRFVLIEGEGLSLGGQAVRLTGDTLALWAL